MNTKTVSDIALERNVVVYILNEEKHITSAGSALLTVTDVTPVNGSAVILTSPPLQQRRSPFS